MTGVQTCALPICRQQAPLGPRAGKRVSMGTGFRVAESLGQKGFEAATERDLQVVGFLVGDIPCGTEGIDQQTLEEVVATDDSLGHAPAVFGQERLASTAPDQEAKPYHALQRLGDGCRRYAELPCKSTVRNLFSFPEHQVHAD